MTWESTKRLIYIQRVGLIVLGCVMLMTFFFVLKSTVSAETYNVEHITNNIENRKYKVQSLVYLVQEAQEIIPYFGFEEEALPDYDLYGEESFQKYLSVDTPFKNLEYIPVDLLPVESSFTANYSKRYYLRKEVGIQFADMAWHFWNDFGGDKIWIASAYRSKTSQESMLRNGCNRVRCAAAGTSEHQAGLVVDMKVISKYGTSYSLYSGSKYYQRFADNAHKRGFHNTYQKGIEVDGQMAEGRHWRYMGTGLATELYEQGITIAEYYKLVRSDEGIVTNIGG